VKRLLSFPAEGGGTILIESDDPLPQGEVTRSLHPVNAIDTAQETFEAAVQRIKPAASAVLSTLRDLNTPDEIEVEFGIKLSASAGAFIASADSEATFNVRLNWKRKEQKVELNQLPKSE
jgi:Trypsin-co-occurring domain 1